MRPISRPALSVATARGATWPQADGLSSSSALEGSVSDTHHHAVRKACHVVGSYTVTERDRPVVIVGAGAGGLPAATLLAHQDIQSLLVETRREISIYPKARNLTFRSLQIPCGVSDWARRSTRPPTAAPIWSASTR